MMKFSGWAAAVVMLLAGAAALAQETPQAAEDVPIVVEGRRDNDSQIRELVASLPPASANGHLTRFERAACPAVIGLPPSQRALAVERMRAVAAAGGVPLGKPNCRVNVLVIVAADKKLLIEQLAKLYPYYFGEMSGRQVKALAAKPGPAALWQMNGLVDADGRDLDTAGGGVMARRTTRGASRITDLAHPDLSGSILVVEAGALVGLTTTQLADYAALRTLTGADPARVGEGKLSTILTVLDAPMGGEVPVTLTPWDLAFIKSFYAMETNRFAPAQRGQIKRGMEKALKTGDPG